MQWHEIIFSEKKPYRLLRHTAFWVVWWLYFSACQYLYQQPMAGTSKVGSYYVTVGSWVFIKTFLLMVIDAAACYPFIYLLMPQFLISKWIRALASSLVLCVFLFAAAYFLYWYGFPFVDSLFGEHKPRRFTTWFWPAVSLGLIDPLKVIAAAAIIKYVKYWWLKKKESEELQREKITAELQLLKAQIHPGFLLNTLNNIYDYSLAVSPRAPELLLKLSDLLSYMLYECDRPLVPLEREIAMMKDYITLEKTRLNDSIEMELSITGNMNDKMIAPFLLLPFIENSFKQSSQCTEQGWINMDISINDNSFVMKLANGIVPRTTGDEICFVNVQKRLNLIYMQKHKLKIRQETEMQIVLLEIQFAETAYPELTEDRNALLPDPPSRQSNLYA